MRTERILADLGYHARRAAQPRDRGGDIRRRAARHALKMGDLVQRAAFLLRHKVNEQLPDRHNLFHIRSSSKYRSIALATPFSV